MKLSEIKSKLPEEIYEVLKNQKIDELRPAQKKALEAGLLEGKNLLVCTPTSSGKTLIAEFAMLDAILKGRGKALYIVPMKALASEKFRDFKSRYGGLIRVALSIGDTDSSDNYLIEYDIIICTAEKLDSLIRHSAPWIKFISVVIIDEIHMINDPGRGPTLEILITLLREILKNVQIIALSATIGNPQELASWLKAELVIDNWRPVKLYKGIYYNGEITFRK